MSKEFIKIGGAREHNLKNLSLQIPRDKLVVVTGLSGSGKSSLAFDTIYAEGQRKYVESLSAYARQFLDQLQKPDVDFIEGLSPAIAIEQRGSGSSPRSIIATTTEVYDYLRLLYAHIGKAHCPDTGVPISTQSTSDIVDKILTLPAKTRASQPPFGRSMRKASPRLGGGEVVASGSRHAAARIPARRGAGARPHRRPPRSTASRT